MTDKKKGDTFEVTPAHIKIARLGVKSQAEEHDLDLNDPKVNNFLEAITRALASRDANIGFLYSILNKPLTGDD